MQNNAEMWQYENKQNTYNALVTCEIKLFCNNFEIISGLILGVTTSETEIKLFQRH